MRTFIRHKDRQYKIQHKCEDRDSKNKNLIKKAYHTT